MRSDLHRLYDEENIAVDLGEGVKGDSNAELVWTRKSAQLKVDLA